MRRTALLAAVSLTLLYPRPSSAEPAAPAASLPPSSTRTDVTFATDIRPIFEVSCLRCHGAEHAKGNIHLDTLEGVLKGGEDGKIVRVGDSAHSQLVLAVARVDERSAMPPIRKPRPGGPPLPAGKALSQGLTAEQVGLIRAWIDQGAK